MSKVKIMPQNFTGDVRQISVTGQQATFSEQDLPCEFVFNQETTVQPPTIDIIADDGSLEPVVMHLTPVAKLTKQTGTHQITTSNGFSATGTIDELADNLRNFGIELSVQDDVMIFTNTLEQEVLINIQAQGRSGKNYVAIEQENTSILLDGKNVVFQLAAVIVATNDVIPSVARLSHGNNLYNLRVSNGYSTKPRFSISTSDFVKAGIHAYIENGQLVLSNRTPEEITVNLSTYDAEFVTVEQENKTVQINAKSVNLTLGAYRGVDFSQQQGSLLPLLNHIRIPEANGYKMSYRINDGPIETQTFNSIGAEAQVILANQSSMMGGLFSNGHYSFGDEESRIRPFLLWYNHSLRGADRNHPNFIRHAHFKVEFLLTENAEYDFVKLAFGQNTAFHSYAIANWINPPASPQMAD